MGYRKIPIANTNLFASVSESDYELLSKNRWILATRSNTNYTSTYVKFKKRKYGVLYMHRMILGLGIGDKRKVDHIDGNGLNNTRENLRICTQQQNQMNRKPNKIKKYKYKGVCFHKKSGMWHSKIMINRERISLKYHRTEKDAAIAYNDAAKKYFGEYARLNVL